ncbi:hypothetical protein CHU00_06715 [Sphingobacterium cellulitidis]|uniref:hypothetical protein n=1 Tax=Sphingobacterium cellulitidis TaxID=1768011 RepID=UPI000B93EDDB|nr:hypothetical protein [Sphingobacterium cellulitidis]OYD46375.1 hypothetical protein CHU00_06715 [Sphingobacterium cellulitidis]
MPTEREQLYLHVIRSVTGKLEKQLYPHPVVRALYRLKALVYDRPIYLKKLERQRAENMEQLSGQLRSFGFASYTGKLDSYLDYERRDVHIPMTAQLGEGARMDIELKLESERTGTYGLAGYRASLYQDRELRHSYTFGADSGITATEATNLLQGRAICKSHLTTDGSIERKWLQLDFNGTEPKLAEFHHDYGYDLKKELATTGKDLSVDGLARENTIRELEAGKMIAVEIPGKGRHYLQADPAERSLRAMDDGKKPVVLSELVGAIKQEKATAHRSEPRLFRVPENRQEQDRSLGIS